MLPIVIWIMRDQFAGIPTELEEAALVDGLSIWGAFLTIILPIALPGMVAAFILSLVLTWNEYFFAALLTSTHANTLPVMVASQTGIAGDQLVVDGGAVDGGDPAAGGRGRPPRAVHHQGHGGRRGEVTADPVGDRLRGRAPAGSSERLEGQGRQRPLHVGQVGEGLVDEVADVGRPSGT